MFRKGKSMPEDWRVPPLQRSAVTRQATMVAACIAIIAVFQRPGWAANNIGFYPFPTDIADEVHDIGSRMITKEDSG